MEKDLEEISIEQEALQEFEPMTPYLSPTATPEEIIRITEGCPICGTRLHATYFADFGRLLTHEVVRCDDCGYREKRSIVRLI